MQYDLDRNKGPTGEPSLASTIYFFCILGCRIDHGHHGNNAKRALFDALAFEDAVKIATEMTDENDTLIIVTSDHAHVVNLAGYPKRGNTIFGIKTICVHYVNKSHFTTLLYGNGPGYGSGNRTDVHAADTTDKEYIQVAATPRFEDSQGGQDVGIYARGPMAHLIHGVHEQHYIAHVMTYAACVADNNKRCEDIVGNGVSSNSVTDLRLVLVTCTCGLGYLLQLYSIF
ncbi:Alkaline phosphatase, tissue-nonspecific isozyme [Mizuhopecten yessoensis]|uniref:Alkaline phosphatase, tissue-nonspecific isozyme n=1 Tax=Mizuhopecten yessoensis TaxID=6573 RepID=A0A210PMN5_MIZYE|nr:Alkaline phosphatase, tissue-nonspecific isozyme [Mizuhopecten yessoensis]